MGFKTKILITATAVVVLCVVAVYRIGQGASSAVRKFHNRGDHLDY